MLVQLRPIFEIFLDHKESPLDSSLDFEIKFLYISLMLLFLFRRLGFFRFEYLLPNPVNEHTSSPLRVFVVFSTLAPIGLHWVVDLPRGIRSALLVLETLGSWKTDPRP